MTQMVKQNLYTNFLIGIIFSLIILLGDNVEYAWTAYFVSRHH